MSANLAAADQASVGLPVLAYFNGQVPLARQKAVADAYEKQYGKPERPVPIEREEPDHARG